MSKESYLEIVLANEKLHHYSPDQARDEHGRWSGDGGSEASTKEKQRAMSKAYDNHVNQQGTLLQRSAYENGTNSPAFKKDLDRAIKDEAHFHSMANAHGTKLQYPGHLDYYTSRKVLKDAGIPV